MKEILTALVESLWDQSVAVQAVADHVSAMREVLKREPQFARDFAEQLAKEQKKSRESVVKLQTMIAGLKEHISDMTN